MRAALIPTLGCLVATLTASAAAPDQNNRRGSIAGTVLGQTGRLLQGVKVVGTPTGAAGGPKVAYSDDKGAFRLDQLRFGTWEVRFTGADLKTLVRRGVLVATTVPTELRVVMEVEVGGVEEVRAPIRRLHSTIAVGGGHRRVERDRPLSAAADKKSHTAPTAGTPPTGAPDQDAVEGWVHLLTSRSPAPSMQVASVRP